MARIRLAHWHDGHNPGDEIDVPDDDLPGLLRDGRVAEVLSGEGALPLGLSTEVNSSGEPEPVLTADQWEQVQAASDTPPAKRPRRRQEE